MTWEYAAMIPVVSIPFFFVFLGNSFEGEDNVFVLVRASSYIVALFSMNFVVNFATNIVEDSESTAVNTIATLGSVSENLFYIGLVFVVFLVFWYLKGMLMNVANMRGQGSNGG